MSHLLLCFPYCWNDLNYKLTLVGSNVETVDSVFWVFWPLEKLVHKNLAFLSLYWTLSHGKLPKRSIGWFVRDHLFIVHLKGPSYSNRDIFKEFALLKSQRMAFGFPYRNSSWTFKRPLYLMILPLWKFLVASFKNNPFKERVFPLNYLLEKRTLKQYYLLIVHYRLFPFPLNYQQLLMQVGL